MKLLLFYDNLVPDHVGRYLDDILLSPDNFLESSHDYIQWLFPNRKPSFINPHAPVLTDDLVKHFKLRPDLIENVRRSLKRMIKFYQMDIEHPWWVSKNNHNFSRCTRILHTLKELEMNEDMMDFMNKLYKIYESNHSIIDGAVDYWMDVIDPEQGIVK